MELFKKKSRLKFNSIENLKSCELDLVFGGDKNDCICYFYKPYYNRFVMRGHHDIDSIIKCEWICCSDVYSYSYQYKQGLRITCPERIIENVTYNGIGVMQPASMDRCC